MPPQYQQGFESEQKTPIHQNPWIVPISIIIAGACVGLGIYFSTTKAPSLVGGANSQTMAIGDVNVSPITAQDHILGDPNAPVKIIEFSDIECPFCKDFHIVMQKIMDDYGKTGQVAWVFRQFPVDQLHKRAHKEAVATECANTLGGPGKFWEYLNTIFARTQSNDTFNPSELPVIAKELGLNVDKFNECLSTTKYDAMILSQSQDAVRSGATGTPFSVLITASGEKLAIKGSQPYDVIKSIIDTALAQANGTTQTSQ